MTNIKSTPDAGSSKITADTEPTEPKAPLPRTPDVIGPPLPVGAEPETVVLSHHLAIGGKDYAPGARILIAPDYARRLRGQGYVART
ncbi:hypothetical protein G3I60_05335 [Streptomyces sp. SID13666]|uniref:hypothetical protein n=1 Tax=Streptomyces sp. SID13666 TaxID=2706054 RepID=UPI0013BF8287|nr:hypothetical protein [Streptomyces sp. SID13666]NEA53594.1 hypothetical protein [Streptomyces sp. SID13666]